jgi:hypothetical protein
MKIIMADINSVGAAWRILLAACRAAARHARGGIARISTARVRSIARQHRYRAQRARAA